MLGHAPLSQSPLSTLVAATLADARIGAFASDDASVFESIVAADEAARDAAFEHASAPLEDGAAVVDATIVAPELEQAQILEPYDDALQELVRGPPDQDEADDETFVVFEGDEYFVFDAAVEELFAGSPEDTLPPAPVPTLSIGGGGVAAPQRKRATTLTRAGHQWPEPDPWPSRPFARARQSERRVKRKPKPLKPNDPESQRELELLLAIALGLESED